MSSCKGCGKAIFFVETKTGKRMPVELKPVKAYRYVSAADSYEMIEVFIPHWANCPDAESFRTAQEKDDASFKTELTVNEPELVEGVNEDPQRESDERRKKGAEVFDERFWQSAKEKRL
jgi:hypothetical protein